MRSIKCHYRREKSPKTPSSKRVQVQHEPEYGTWDIDTEHCNLDRRLREHPPPSPLSGEMGKYFQVRHAPPPRSLPPAKREKNEENNGSSHQQPLCAASHPRSSLLAGPETRLSADGTSFSQWPNSQASSSSFDRVPKTGVACCAHTLSGFISQFCDLLRFFLDYKRIKIQL